MGFPEYIRKEVIPERCVKDIGLEKVYFEGRRKIPDMVLENMKISIYEDNIFMGEIIRLIWEVYEECMDVTEASIYQGAVQVVYDRDCLFDVPESWWDMFKERYFPAWALKKWPAKKKQLRQNYYDVRTVFDPRKLDVKVVAVYPELPIAFPKCGPYMVRTLVGNNYKVTYPQSNGTAIVSIKER